MKNNLAIKVYRGVVKPVPNESNTARGEYNSKPFMLTDKQLKRELCEPAHNAKQCIKCECIGWCEYGNEAVRRFKRTAVL